VDGSNPEQMVMFLSGEGGTGKSHVIHLLTLLVQTIHGKTEGRFGSVLKTAPTGGAAYNINGFTWQSALGKTDFKAFKQGQPLSQTQLNKLRHDFLGTVFFVLD